MHVGHHYPGVSLAPKGFATLSLVPGGMSHIIPAAGRVKSKMFERPVNPAKPRQHSQTVMENYRIKI